MDPALEVGGQDISFAATSFDPNGQPSVALSFTEKGSERFFALTSSYPPQGTNQTQLGIILDDVVLSAPNILSPIRSEARITGNFTADEVLNIVSILKVGQFPAKLVPIPISESDVEVVCDLFGNVVVD